MVEHVNYSYDTNGNLNDGTYKYYYDCENRLTDVKTHVESSVASYAYDSLGRRISKTVGSTTTKYVYDGDPIIAEYNGSILLRKYVYGPGIDEPICMINMNGTSETKFYYHFDGLGSVVALTDNSGGTVISVSSVANRFMFTGREWDSESGNYYYRARYYKPAIGKFLQSDPIRYEDSMNLYSYVMNSPIIWIDPAGTNAISDLGWGALDYGACIGRCVSKYGAGNLNWEVIPGWRLIKKMPILSLPCTTSICTKIPGISPGLGKHIGRWFVLITIGLGAWDAAALGYCGVQCLNCPNSKYN